MPNREEVMRMPKKSCPKNQVYSKEKGRCIKEPYRINPIYVYVAFFLVAFAFIVGVIFFEVQSAEDSRGFPDNLERLVLSHLTIFGSLLAIIGLFFLVPWTPPFGAKGVIAGIILIIIGAAIAIYFYGYTNYSIADYLFRLGLRIGLVMAVPFFWPTGLKGIIIGGLIFIVSYILLIWGFLFGL